MCERNGCNTIDDDTMGANNIYNPQKWVNGNQGFNINWNQEYSKK